MSDIPMIMPENQGGNSVLIPVRGEFEIFVTDLETGIVTKKDGTNMIVDTGREELLRLLFAVGASAPAVALCVGASTTPAADPTDTRLIYELIGNPTRKALTNTSGAALSNSDIVTDITTIGGVQYRRKLVCMAVYTSADLNNGNQFGEYALSTTLTNPATPTSTSGVIINHYIDPAPTFKSSGNAVQVQVTIRF